jgi:hypothetical protein
MFADITTKPTRDNYKKYALSSGTAAVAFASASIFCDLMPVKHATDLQTAGVLLFNSYAAINATSFSILTLCWATSKKAPKNPWVK